MLLIDRPQTDPYFNLAAEEYLLKNMKEDCFMLWVSEPSIIIGKHQNAFAEISRQFVKENDIPVVRRISGGGTVFHDPGNLNFSFISHGEKEKLVDFRRFTLPIIDYLNSLGLPARFEGKNDIRIHGLKISGNAEHVYHDKVLHHGTLLFNARLGRLNQAIKGQELLFTDKAVRSMRSTVTNISELLDHPLSMKDFQKGIIDHMKSRHPNLKTTMLDAGDIHSIDLLAKEKYKSWEWNFGYSPKFTFEKQVTFKKLRFRVIISVHKGIISQIQAEGKEVEMIPLQALTGLKFDEKSLLENFHASRFNGILKEFEYHDLLTLLLY